MERHPGADPPAPPTGPWVGPGDLAARLERWAADARVGDAARRRAREHWLRHQATEAASLVGVLLDLGERAEPVTVQTLTGRRYPGVVRGVGSDFVAVESPPGAVLVALRAVGSVRTLPGRPATLGDRPLAGRATSEAVPLADVLAGMAADREQVLLVPLPGAEPVGGTLESVGQDVAVVRTAGEQPGRIYVPLRALGEVVLPA
jgi:hypothetical protein